MCMTPEDAIKERIKKNTEILNDPMYVNTINRIQSLNAKIQKANRFSIEPIQDECKTFITGLQTTRPDIYKILRAEINGLSSGITKKITGLDIIID